MMIRLIVSVLLLCAAPFAMAQETEETFEAHIDGVNDIACDDRSDGCKEWSLTGLNGAMDGTRFSIITDTDDGIGTTTPQYEAGDRVIVQSHVMNGQRQFILSDIARRTPIVWLCVVFVAAVWLFGGVQSLRSFMGMIASLAVLFLFVLPQILQGRPPMLIGLTGSFAIMALTFLLGHGWNKKTLAAFIGTCGSLILTALIAWGFSVYAHLTGLADEEISYLLNEYPDLHTQGILLAAVVIGTLGILDDITISQASAVYELRKANPLWTAGRLYRSAYRIGSDHIAAAINTLILAYAGSALPLLLLLIGTPSGEPWWIFLSREPVATEIVRTLVGSIGLLAAVPLTTWIASMWAVQSKPLEVSKHGNHHH